MSIKSLTKKHATIKRINLNENSLDETGVKTSLGKTENIALLVDQSFQFYNFPVTAVKHFLHVL